VLEQVLPLMAVQVVLEHMEEEVEVVMVAVLGVRTDRQDNQVPVLHQVVVADLLIVLLPQSQAEPVLMVIFPFKQFYYKIKYPHI
jgi:hypothetical protein